MTRQQVMNGLRWLALFGFLCAALALAGCKAGRGSNVENPQDGTAQCVVADRSYNSNNTLVITVDCNGGGTGFGPQGGVRAFVDPNAHPMCRQGAAWPGCKG
jgi:hypothetical protein